MTVRQAKACPALARRRPSGKLPGWGTLLEVCTSPDSTLGQVVAEEFDKVNVVRKTEEVDWADADTVQQTMDLIDRNPGISAHGSLPCTAWSTWQNMAIHRFGKGYLDSLERRRDASRQMLRSFIRCAELIIQKG